MFDRRRDVALFRYSLIREAADPALTNAERGVLVRALAARDHVGPGGARVRVARNTVDRWIRAWKVGGFDALVPAGRTVEPSTPAAMVDLAVKLKREVPGRTAAQVAEIIAASQGWSPSRRTVQRLFANLGLNTRPDGSPPAAFGRFEAAAANDRWTGDALHGPVVGGHKAYLFAFIDDYSRAIPGYRWGHSEDTVRLEAALRHGLASRGIPRSIYVDNGSAFVAAPLLRACAVLGIRLVHSRPGRPEGRGKIERFFRTVRDQFLVEISARGDISDLIGMNRLFAAWVETAYHRRVHSETKAAPLERFMTSGPFLLPTPDQLHEAFLWSEQRTFTKTATVSLHANTYEVDASLVGRRVELIFDPFDLTAIEVRWQGRPMGRGVPRVIGRHTQPMAKPEQVPPPALPVRSIWTGGDSRSLPAGVPWRSAGVPTPLMVEVRTSPSPQPTSNNLIPGPDQELLGQRIEQPPLDHEPTGLGIGMPKRVRPRIPRLTRSHHVRSVPRSRPDLGVGDDEHREDAARA